jgi:hypothetical protein
MADNDGFVTAYATPSTYRQATAAVGVELTQQEQAIWNAAFGATYAINWNAESALHGADGAVREFRKLQAGPRANLGKVV